MNKYDEIDFQNKAIEIIMSNGEFSSVKERSNNRKKKILKIFVICALMIFFIIFIAWMLKIIEK